MFNVPGHPDSRLVWDLDYEWGNHRGSESIYCKWPMTTKPEIARKGIMLIQCLNWLAAERWILLPSCMVPMTPSIPPMFQCNQCRFGNHNIIDQDLIAQTCIQCLMIKWPILRIFAETWHLFWQIINRATVSQQSTLLNIAYMSALHTTFMLSVT